MLSPTGKDRVEPGPRRYLSYSKWTFQNCQWTLHNLWLFRLSYVLFTPNLWRYKLVAFQGSHNTSSLTSCGYSSSSLMYSSEISLSSQDEGDHPNLAIGADKDPSSSTSIPPQPLVSNVIANFACSFFRPIFLFWRLFIVESCKKSVQSRMLELMRQTDTTKEPSILAAPDSVHSWFCNFLAWFGNKWAQKPALEKWTSRNATVAN